MEDSQTAGGRRKFIYRIWEPTDYNGREVIKLGNVSQSKYEIENIFQNVTLLRSENAFMRSL